MQGVRLLCVGRLRESWLREAQAEYQKRLSGYCRLEIVELAEARLPDSPGEAQIAAALAREGREILARSRGGIVALCIEGTELSSPALARTLADAALCGESELTFVVGGSFGLDGAVKRAAQLRLSMSPMTFPHTLARVLLLEQLYRAYSINAGGKYHK